MALSILNSANGSNGNPPPSFTSGAAVAVGDVIVDAIQLFSSATNTAAVTDTVNTGSYTLAGSALDDISNGNWLQWLYMICNAAGTPTLSVTLGTNETGRHVYSRITGFAGTPTPDAAMTQQFKSAATTTVSIPLPNTAQDNEAVLLLFKSGSTLTATPPGWTSLIGNELYGLIAPTAGISAAFNGTLAASAYYDAIVIGIYDAAVGPSTAADWMMLMGCG